MSLTGYRMSRSKRNGGLARIWLAAVPDILSVQTDRNGEIEKVVFKNNGFREYEFIEESASMRQSAASAGGSIVITHELQFDLERIGTNSCNATGELTGASAAGMVALVVTNCGDTFLLGYSRVFGTERPLRLKSYSAATGCSVSEETCCRVILLSQDVAPACKFDGTIPG